MENLVSAAFWRGKRVFLTGHTGFKGSWLALWLQQLGAEVTGFALPPSTKPALYEVGGVEKGMTSVIGDIRDATHLTQALHAARPEIVLHLAAQALVGEGYRDPVGTYATNVLGTANLLEAARRCDGIQAIVVVTSDKCYDNKEWSWPYRENEPLGGHDPYSSSKACAELVTASYRKSFLAAQGIPVASARAGNVFGGGDWSASRLIPDLLQAFASGQPGILRRPGSIRPWQHVLEPLSGYLLLAQKLVANPNLAGAWNFGPGEDDCLTAAQLADRLAKAWGSDANWHTATDDFPHEASTLRLDSSLAKQKLAWKPAWPLDQALQQTISWHKTWLTAADMRETTIRQIIEYSTHADTGH